MGSENFTNHFIIKFLSWTALIDGIDDADSGGRFRWIFTNVVMPDWTMTEKALKAQLILWLDGKWQIYREFIRVMGGK